MFLSIVSPFATMLSRIIISPSVSTRLIAAVSVSSGSAFVPLFESEPLFDTYIMLLVSTLGVLFLIVLVDELECTLLSPSSDDAIR